MVSFYYYYYLFNVHEKPTIQPINQPDGATSKLARRIQTYYINTDRHTEKRANGKLEQLSCEIRETKQTNR